MDRARTTGTVIMAAAALNFLLFAIGALRRRYLALALPVTAAMATLTALAFWVGWTMLTMEDEPEEARIAPTSE